MLIEAVVPLCVGLAVMFGLHKEITGKVLMCVAGFVFLSGNFVPPAYRAFMLVVNKLARFIVVGVTWMLLAPFFYIFFTLGRLILLISGKDPMNRRFPAEEKSCWVPVENDRGLERYEKQY